MKDKRPKNLNLLTIHFPVPAIVSILHRLSGLLLFFLVPFCLWILNFSLASQQNFEYLQHILTLTGVKLILLASFAAFIYHFIAGIRHLLMDIHVGEELKSGRFSAILTIIISMILIIAAGVWLW